MDKVLSRKMFRQKYLENQTPKGFQEGGLGSLDITDEEVKKELNLPEEKPVVPEKPEETTEGSSVEKAFSNLLGLENTTGTLTRSQRLLTIMAPIQAALLNATQNPGESKTSSTLRALGLGLATLPGSLEKISAADLESRKVAVTASTKEGAMSIQQAVQEGLIKEGEIDPDDTGFVKYKQVGDVKEITDAPKISVSFIKDIQTPANKDLYKPETVKFGVQLKKVEDLIKRYVDAGLDIPGVGLNSTIQGLTGEGKEVQGAIQELKNALIKEMSGSAVTGQEYERLKIAFNEGVFAGDQQLIDALVRMRSTYDGALSVYANKYGKKTIADRLLQVHKNTTGYGRNVLEKSGTFFVPEANQRFRIVDGKLTEVKE